MVALEFEFILDSWHSLLVLNPFHQPARNTNLINEAFGQKESLKVMSQPCPNLFQEITQSVRSGSSPRCRWIRTGSGSIRRAVCGDRQPPWARTATSPTTPKYRKHPRFSFRIMRGKEFVWPVYYARLITQDWVCFTIIIIIMISINLANITT